MDNDSRPSGKLNTNQLIGIQTMTKRKPKRSATCIALSSRQWAWEFLRFNSNYREAYAAWMALPDSVRNPGSPDNTPLGDCPPNTPMSYFEVTPIALPNETVAEWLLRTKEEREEEEGEGWSYQTSSELDPPKEFLIFEWVDPCITPLPKEKEHIWDKLDVACVTGLVIDKNLPKRAAVQLPPLTDIHDLAFIVDVRSPLGALEKEFRDAVLLHRKTLCARDVGDEPHVYAGKVIINSNGIYEEYVRILQRLDHGETEEQIRHLETRTSSRLPHWHSYVGRKKKQIPIAIQLRDGGYKNIVFRDDFEGNLKPK